MFKLLIAGILALTLAAAPAYPDSLPQRQANVEQQAPTKRDDTTREVLTDVAIIALIVAASVALYKASGKPCACPEDTMRNGRRCGDMSAYVRGGGAKPLCYPHDITASMISQYRATKKVPGLY
jgi:hypothetical protein